MKKQISDKVANKVYENAVGAYLVNIILLVNVGKVHRNN